MAELEHQSVVHDHEEFLARARRRHGFQTAYDALETKYQVANELIAARARAGLTQEAVAQRMGTTKSEVSRLESAGKAHPIRRHAPALRRGGGLRAQDRTRAEGRMKTARSGDRAPSIAGGRHRIRTCAPSRVNQDRDVTTTHAT